MIHIYPIDTQRSLRKQLRTPGLGPVLVGPGPRGQVSKWGEGGVAPQQVVQLVHSLQ